MGRKRNLKELKAALQTGEPVQLRRSLWKADAQPGIVVGHETDWVGLHVIDDVAFNGWTFVRLDTIARVDRRGTNDLAARVLRRRNQMACSPGVDLTSLQTILADAAEQYPLVTVHREAIDPDVCAVGWPVRLGRRSLHLLDISPDAIWDHEPRRFRYEDITRIDVGGRYEQALHELGGYPPLPR